MSPTKQTYDTLQRAYAHFNRTLFKRELPPCLITLQRKANTRGYYAYERFAERSGESTTDEIALNPTHFKDRTDRESLSTLVHEMVHLWQYHFGTPSNGYHNKEWAAKMFAVGLYPSTTGKPGGDMTGQNCSHYILDDGAFAASYEKFKHEPLYVELWSEAAKKKAAKKNASKTKYTCPDCGANAWAKPGTNLHCGDCDVAMEAQG